MERKSGDSIEWPKWPVGSAFERDSYVKEFATAAARGVHYRPEQTGVRMPRSQPCGTCNHPLGAHGEYHVISMESEVAGVGLAARWTAPDYCSVEACPCRSFTTR